MRSTTLAVLAFLLPMFAAPVRAESSEAELSRGLPAMSEKALSAHHRAVAHWGMGMYETSAAGFEEVLRAAPDQPAVLANLAAVRLIQRRPEAAAELLDRALARFPQSPRLLYLRGRALRLAGDDAQAVRRLGAAAAGDPGDGAVSLALAEALSAGGRARDAESELRRFLRLKPDHGPALFRLARLLAARGERSESDALLKRFGAADRRSAAARSRYDEPVEPPEAAEPGPNRLEVRAVRTRKDRPASIRAFSGGLAVRARAEDAPVRLPVGVRGPIDAVRVDWADGTHSYRLDVSTGAPVVIEEVSVHVW